MSTKKAYFYMFNRLTNLYEALENLQENKKVDTLAIIKQIQEDTEEIYIKR